MQQCFIDKVVNELWQEQGQFEDIIFVLPSRRAGTFLKNAIARTTNQTIFAPEIYSIEHFIEKLAGLAYASLPEQLFALYHAYLEVAKGEKESFYDFSKWARTLLGDFDEIDRYLIPHSKIFSYLSSIKEVNHWYLQKERTALMENYIEFWNSLEPMYYSFTDQLKSSGKGHQGLVYRTAHENLQSYLGSASAKKHIFLGFNALNEAESLIIQTLLEESNAEIFWDLDPYFIDETYHDAGYFIRQHLKQWAYYQNHSARGLDQNYLSPKEIDIVGVPRNVSQVKYMGSVLDQLSQSSSERLQNTALILGDESLLNPLLNALPAGLERANITMGYPLKNTPLANLYGQYFDLYLQSDERGWYYKKILSFLSSPYIQMLVSDEDGSSFRRLQTEVQQRNMNYLRSDFLSEYLGSVTSKLFNKNNYQVSQFLNTCLLLVETLRSKFEKEDRSLELHYLYCFYTLFNQLKEMTQAFPFVADIRSLQALFNELLAQETIDFQGEPMEGLQIMGMLESRVLDFETVIISSVNEGVLPAGKQHNSFIPYDVKKEIGLPTYKEKDAIYTYHFYRLLQRAKKVILIYNTEPDVLVGGEPSRFIHQLKADPYIRACVNHKMAAMDIRLQQSEITEVNKDEVLYGALKALAKSGFSPTSLTEYIKDPIRFYKRYILGIEESPAVDEAIAPNVFGTIIHNALEELLKPFVGEYLNPAKLKSVKPKTKGVVKKYFTRFYDASSIEKGRNLIAYQVLIRNLENFIEEEIRQLEHKKIRLLALEKELDLSLVIPGIDFPVRLKGKLDRIDEVDGEIRILDYKTGRVNLSEMNVVHWEDIIKDPGLNKVFQVLCYAYLYQDQNKVANLQAGIISFKNLRQGFLPFATKVQKTSRTRTTGINAEIMALYQEQLFNLIREICDPDMVLVQSAEGLTSNPVL